jgi:hypothetical protein
MLDEYIDFSLGRTITLGDKSRLSDSGSYWGQLLMNKVYKLLELVGLFGH